MMFNTKIENKFTQPGFISRVLCFILGHKVLYDGFIKERATPTLTSFVYKKENDEETSVGLCFCPRCYSFIGIHYTQKVLPDATKEVVKAFKSLEKSKKKKSIKKLKK